MKTTIKSFNLPFVISAVLFVISAILLAACSNPAAEEGDTITIYLGSSANSRAAAPGTAFNPMGTTFHSKITYKIGIYNLDGNYVTDKSGQGGSAITITLDPGSYYLTAAAKYNGMDYAEIILSPGDDFIEFNTSEKTVTVPMKVITPIFYAASQIPEIEAYLNSYSGTYPTVYMADIEINNTNWTNIRTAINSSGSSGVTLDLTDCTVSGGVFNPGSVSVTVPAIEEIILPSAASSIVGISPTSCSFDYLPNLTTVTAMNVTVIGDYAFAGCLGLTTVNISGATAINEKAFMNCSSLTEVTLTNIQTINVDAFMNCGNLATVTLGAGITSIGNGAFSGCADPITVNCYSTTPPTILISTVFGATANYPTVNIPIPAPPMTTGGMITAYNIAWGSGAIYNETL
jgi:hypothetical protein